MAGRAVHAQLPPGNALLADIDADVRLLARAAVQAAVRLEAARMGILLFRNNVGALIDVRGIPVRYGLANESTQIN